MMDEELLISYLQEQKREYQEQMIILGRKLENLSINNNPQEYIITNITWGAVANIVRVHTDLIERIKNREFDVQMAHSLSTDTIPVNYGFHQVEKSIQSLNDLISSIPEGEYDEDFINEMKRIEKEQSEKLKRRLKYMCTPIEEQLRGEPSVKRLPQSGL